MKQKIYSIYDEKAMAFMTPFYQVSDSLAYRMLTQLVNDETTNVCKYPEDFSLYRLGEWDDVSGGIHQKEMKCLAKATEVKTKKRMLTIEEVFDAVQEVINSYEEK